LEELKMNAHSYDFWRARLDGLPADLTMTKDDATGFEYPKPEPGFYRHRLRDGRWVPLAIWAADDGLWFKLGDGHTKAADSAFSERVFAYACKNPVTHEAYEAAMRGEPWADADPVADAERAVLGHNNPPADLATVLLDEIEAAERNAKEIAEVADDEAAERAQGIRARLNELAGKADKTRETEKAPHLAAGRAVDAKWQPLVKRAKEAADAVKKRIEAYATKKLREQQEAEHKRREEEAARAAAEAAARAVNEPPPAAPEPVAAREPEPVVPMSIKGGYGRAATVVTVKVVTAITDQDALYAYMRARPEVAECLMALAKKAVVAGRTDIPGIVVEEQAKVR
jgi:hypothetical protein